jgi:malonyl-CoA O-methyltransferase
MNSARDNPAFALDRRRLRAQFERAAESYDSAAVLQRRVADEMLERLQIVRREPAAILDTGCGTGYATRALAKRYSAAFIAGVDLAHGMVRQARRLGGWFGHKRYLCADAAQLPFASGSFDLVWSNLMLQWCDPAPVFDEFLRVLRPDGLLTFTTFGPDTLRELRAAWDGVDGAEHVHGFLDMHDIGDALVRAGFAEPVLDVERYTLSYPTVEAVLEELKALGAHNALQGRPRGLMGRRRYARFKSVYEQMAQDGRIPATYEVVYGHAWAPQTPKARRRADGAVTVSLDQLRRRK